MLQILVVFYLVWNLLETVYIYGSCSTNDIRVYLLPVVEVLNGEILAFLFKYVTMYIWVFNNIFYSMWGWNFSYIS